jgi:serine/threonine protein phosphatase PrpC
MVATETEALKSLDGGTDSAGTSVAFHSLTHEGSWRSRNDDAYCTEVKANPRDGSSYLFAVADGLGGFRRGDVASQTAIQTLTSEFCNWQGGSGDRFLTRAIRDANQKVYDDAHADPDQANMQTTLTAVAIEQDRLTVGHVGDCRLYRIRDEQTQSLTRDHSFANDLLRLHLISPAQVLHHPERNRLTRTVGCWPILHIDIIREKILAGDTYILCCDGLWAEIPENEINALVHEKEPAQACQALLDVALKRGAPDNITLIVFRIDRVGKNHFSTWRGLLGK